MTLQTPEAVKHAFGNLYSLLKGYHLHGPLLRSHCRPCLSGMDRRTGCSLVSPDLGVSITGPPGPTEAHTLVVLMTLSLFPMISAYAFHWPPTAALS